jgi:hypothetical protein
LFFEREDVGHKFILELPYISYYDKSMKKDKKIMGRPKLPAGDVRKVFPLRLSDSERKRIEKAARQKKEKPTEWARNTLLAAAP